MDSNLATASALGALYRGVAYAAVYAAVLAWPAWRAAARYRRLPMLNPAPAPSAEDHIVLIAADERASNIERAVKSFDGSLVCVVVDDTSTPVAQRAAAAGATVIQSALCKTRWTRHNMAEWTGVAQSESKWILFADARASFAPGFADALLDYAVRQRVQAVAVVPRRDSSWLANLLLDAAAALGFVGVRERQTVPPHADETVLAGSCLLIQRSSYEFIGTHAAVREAEATTMALAQLLRRHVIAFHVVRAERLARVHLDASFFGALHEGTARFLLLSPGAKRRALGYSALLSVGMLSFLWMAGDAFLPGLVLLWLAGAWFFATASRSYLRGLLVFLAAYVAVPAALASLAVHYFGTPEHLRRAPATK